ncbi:MAG: hypothetical protein IJL78_00585 [Lachnospiraceae bacterium]|nr:hypothetical protein [Lachnospiraceae bacterium]
MKKIFAIILAVVMLVSTSGVVLAAESNPEFRVSTEEAEPGDSVELTVSMVNNPGIAAFLLNVNYDSNVLEWTGITKGSLPETYNLEVNTPAQWYNYTTDFTGDAVIFSLQFKVKANAPAGLSEVSVSYDKPGNVVNNAYKKLPFECVAGGVNVKGTAPEPHTHKWNDGVVTKQPTCTEKGIKTFTCTDCGETKTEDIPATGHNWNDGVVTKKPTCTEKGIKTFTCTNCGETKTEDIKATGHNWGEWVTVKEPTTEEEGLKERVCLNDPTHKETEKIDKLPPHTHKWNDGVVTKEPTCTEKGIKTFTCTICGETKTEDIPATGHTWGEWKVVEEATEEKEGKKVRVCKNDPEHTEEEVIPKVTPEVPPTGDSSNMGLWAVMMLAAAAALAFLGFKRRRV